jgi:hypothetical protein
MSEVQQLLSFRPRQNRKGSIGLQAQNGRRYDDNRARSDKDFPTARDQRITPYLHDGRLLTLKDTLEFFNLVLRLNLTSPEKKDMVAFMQVL